MHLSAWFYPDPLKSLDPPAGFREGTKKPVAGLGRDIKGVKRK